MATIAGMGLFQWVGASIFAGTAGTLYHLRGLGNGLADLGGLVGDVRRGEIGLVTQVFRQLQSALSQVQQVVSSPMQSFFRGMISQESWEQTEQSMRRILEAVQQRELPNAIDLKDLQLFIELLIPDLMPRHARGVVPSTVNEWMDATEQRQLRQLHALITKWLGEDANGEVHVAFVDVENILTNFLRVDVGVAEEPSQRRGRILRTIESMTGADLIAPVQRVVRIWRAFDPEQIVPNVAQIVSDLCIQYANPDVPSKRTELGIDDVHIHENEVLEEKLLQMGRAFQEALEEKNIPLYAIGQLTEGQIEEMQERILCEGEGAMEGTLLEGFFKRGDVIGTRNVEIEVFHDAEENGVQEEVAPQYEEVNITATRGSEVLYVELLQKSIAALQAQHITSKEGAFTDGLSALQGVRRKYRTLFQQPPQELFTIHEALRLIVDNPKLNARQQRTVINAQAIASGWLEEEMPHDLYMPEERRAEFNRALETLTQVTIEHDHRGIIHQPYTVRLPEDQAGIIRDLTCVQRVLERNEGSLQRPVRQTLDRVGILKDSLGDLINMLITAPRTLLDTYTRPSVVAAIAIGILLFASLMSAIFSLGSLHCLTALSMAGGLSIGLHVWNRAAARGNTESVEKAMLVMAGVALDAIGGLNDRLVKAQREGSAWLNSKFQQIPIIRHPMTI